MWQWLLDKLHWHWGRSRTATTLEDAGQPRLLGLVQRLHPPANSEAPAADRIVPEDIIDPSAQPQVPMPPDQAYFQLVGSGYLPPNQISVQTIGGRVIRVDASRFTLDAAGVPAVVTQIELARLADGLTGVDPSTVAVCRCGRWYQPRIAAFVSTKTAPTEPAASTARSSTKVG